MQPKTAAVSLYAAAANADHMSDSDRLTSITMRPAGFSLNAMSKKTLGLAISAGWTADGALKSFPVRTHNSGPQGTEKDGGMWIKFI